MNLWSYDDHEDAGDACRLSLEADLDSHQKLVIAASDTLMDIETSQLLHDFYPDVAVSGQIGGYQSLLSSQNAREKIGYEPRFSWRDRCQVQG